MRSILLAMLLCLTVRGAVAAAGAVAPAPATQPIHFGPVTVVTLHIKNARPGDVFAEIARQTGVPLPLASPSLFDAPAGDQPPTITVDMDRIPFWIALSNICSQCDAAIKPVEGTPGRPLLVDQSFGRHFLTGRFDDRGLFVFEPSRISIERSVYLVPGSISYGRDETQKNDEIEFNLYVDPKAPLSSLDEIRLTQAIDEQGHSLLPTRNEDRPEAMPLVQGLIVQPRCALDIPPDSTGFISDLRGSIDVSMSVTEQRVIVRDVATAKRRPTTLGDFVFQILAFSAPDRGATLQIALRNRNPQISLDRVEQLLHQIKLIDASGQTVMSRGDATWADDECVYDATFIADQRFQPPIQLLWEIPGKVEHVSVPFEFHNLRLPQR